MSVAVYLYAERTKLAQEPLDLFLLGITTHVAQVFVRGSGQDLVNHARQFVGDGYLGLVLGP
jgi:hypothetical protein